MAVTYLGKTCETRPLQWIFLASSIKALCNKMQAFKANFPGFPAILPRSTQMKPNLDVFEKVMGSRQVNFSVLEF